MGMRNKRFSASGKGHLAVRGNMQHKDGANAYAWVLYEKSGYRILSTTFIPEVAAAWMSMSGKGSAVIRYKLDRLLS